MRSQEVAQPKLAFDSGVDGFGEVESGKKIKSCFSCSLSIIVIDSYFILLMCKLISYRVHF